MRFNENTISDINKAIMDDPKYYDLGLKIGFSGEDVCRYSGGSGWQICKISELTDMIKSLENVRTMIERVTGVEC